MGCIELKTQVKFLGFTGIIVCILLLFVYGIQLNEVLETQSISDQHTDDNWCNYNPLSCITPSEVISLYMVAITLWIIPHALLIYGTVRRNHLLLLPWLISMAIFFVVVICGMLIRLVTKIDSYAQVWPVELIRIIIISFLMFNWYLVLIYYRQLRLNLKIQILQHFKSFKKDSVPYNTLEEQKIETLTNVD